MLREAIFYSYFYKYIFYIYICIKIIYQENYVKYICFTYIYL